MTKVEASANRKFSRNLRRGGRWAYLKLNGYVYILVIVRAWARLEIRLGLDDFLPGSARLELDVYERAQARARLGLEKIGLEQSLVCSDVLMGNMQMLDFAFGIINTSIFAKIKSACLTTSNFWVQTDKAYLS